VRAILAQWAYPSMDDEQQIAALKGSLYSNVQGSRLRKSMIKVRLRNDLIVRQFFSVLHGRLVEHEDGQGGL